MVPTGSKSLPRSDSIVSFSCPSNREALAQYEGCGVSGATGANGCAPALQVWNRKLPSDSKMLGYIIRRRSRFLLQRQTSIFATEPRPLIVFVDGRVHLGKTQAAKDKELRCLLRKKGYKILELYYESYSDKKRDLLYEQILDNLGKEQPNNCYALVR
jgi:very-short-patch-repair endonuclease